jgi:HK97 family phage portal protein
VALFSRTVRSTEPGPGQPLIPYRWSNQAGSVLVDSDTAFRHSAVWAAARLRADMVSTIGLYAWKNNPDGSRRRVALPAILTTPSGNQMDISEWLYSSQTALDLRGNNYGRIMSRDGFGRPTQIELVHPDNVSVRQINQGKIAYFIKGVAFDPVDIWHERQNTIPGALVGMSSIAYAAWTISAGLSAQRFGLDWFRNGAFPSGHLKNVAKMMQAKEAEAVKERFMDSVAARQPFVSGADWDFKSLTVNPNESQFLETIKASVNDVARFMSVPAEMIGGSSGSALTYASVEQRSLDFLTYHFDPTLVRRERILSRLVPDGTYVQFDRDNLLRTDLLARSKAYHLGVNARFLTPDDVRKKEFLPPLTEKDWEQFGKIPSAQPALAEGGNNQ